MKAFIMAAGLGTRLKPFTLTNPKALVPVGGEPMLKRVIERLKSEGFDDIVINVHHFADKIEEYVRANGSFGVRIRFSDERDLLRDTGGAIFHAEELLSETPEPFLIHNVDILSDAPLRELMSRHEESRAAASLLVSGRESSRKLIFGADGRLRGWHNLKEDIYKPVGFEPMPEDTEYAFSGIHVMSPGPIYAEMKRQRLTGAFSIIDFYLAAAVMVDVKSVFRDNLRLIDIGKPETLAKANELFL